MRSIRREPRPEARSRFRNVLGSFVFPPKRFPRKDFLSFVLAAAVAIFLLWPFFSPAQMPDDAETALILSAAESHFKAMKEKKYVEIWRTLTEKSRVGIVRNVVDSSGKKGHSLKPEETRADFESGGPLAKAYWDAYLTVFNPDMVLEQSAWSMGLVKKNETELLIRHRKAAGPAKLYMKKENGVWKVGLEETFGILRQFVK